MFSCYTGLSYIDVKELTGNNIVKGIDNNNWIYTKREKTDEQIKVPILHILVKLTHVFLFKLSIVNQVQKVCISTF